MKRIIYKDSDNLIRMAYLVDRNVMKGVINDYLLSTNKFDIEINTSDVNICLIKNNELIIIGENEYKKSDFNKVQCIRYIDGEAEMVWIKNGCKNIFEKNFGKIIKIKEVKNE